MAEQIENTQKENQEVVDTTIDAKVQNETTTNVENAEATVETTTETSTETTTAETAETKVETTAEPTTVKKSIEELLAENGYSEDLELLREIKANKQKEVEEKEKPFNETKEWADLIDFGAKNKLATKEDFLTHTQINSEKDEVLAFNKFKDEYKPDEYETDLTSSELDEVIRERFEEKYELYSENDRLKKMGLDEIKKVADEIRKPLNDKIQTVRTSLLANSMYKQHSTALEEFNKNPYTDSITVKDESGNDISIDIEVLPELKKSEIDGILKDEANKPLLDAMFTAFVSSTEAGDKAFGEFLQLQFQQKQGKLIQQKIAEQAYSKGLEKAKELSVGAKAPFDSKENNSIKNGQKDEPLRQYSGGKYAK